MNILFFALIALVEAVVDPNSKERLSSSSILASNLSSLNRSNTVQFGYCESGWTYFNETDACYKNFFSATFQEAETRCRDFEGGHLTSIHSHIENSFVAALARMRIRMSTNQQGTWIGLVRSDYWDSKRKDDWMWIDGTKVDFLAWGPGAPNNWGDIERCVSMIKTIDRSATVCFKPGFTQTAAALNIENIMCRFCRCSSLKQSFVSRE